jgi:CheY-like chemotaxis protein/glyoxylase-like metal-dependent hydrolase (beta-lactamase superfamily II)
MQIQFWGTRGSLAKPGPTTLRYGGNTSCVAVRTAEGTLIVLDCGTGAHGLGLTLLASDERPLRGNILIGHTHWDHIQGLPFFLPLFAPGNEWDIYAPKGLGQHLEETLAGQMQYTYFPVTLAQLGATIRCHDLVEGSFDAGGVRVTTQYLNHPALCLGYRLEADGVTVVYATDHEPHSPLQADAEPGSLPVHAEDQRHAEFLRGADLLIHDAQYTAAEYPQKVGWGHSTVEYVVDMAMAAGVKRLALFHHDPLRHDEAVDALVEDCHRRVATAGGELDVIAAAEGLLLDVDAPWPMMAALGDQAPTAEGQPEAPHVPKVLVVDDEPDVLRLLTLTLRPEGFDLLTASDGDAALYLARAEHPDLILLDRNMPGCDGLAVCRVLRAESDSRLREVPIVLITAQASAQDMEEGFAAGVTDYLTKPFTGPHVRTRARAWLLRARAPARV